MIQYHKCSNRAPIFRLTFGAPIAQQFRSKMTLLFEKKFPEFVNDDFTDDQPNLVLFCDLKTNIATMFVAMKLW